MNKKQKFKRLVKFLFFGLFVFTFIKLCSPHHTEASVSDEKPIIVNTPSYILEVIYVPNTFSQEEKQLFEDAAAEWTNATAGIAQIIIVFEDMELSFMLDRNHLYNGRMTISIAEQLPSNSLFVIFTDLAIHGDMLGYYEAVNFNPPKIFVVPERMGSLEEYKAVILHELGHSLGLEHNRERFTLMYKIINYGMACITKTDLANFCSMYGCNENNLNYCTPKIEETVCLNEDF